MQFAKVICYFREHAEQYHIGTNKIVVQGLAAGGHLPASLGVFWNQPDVAKSKDYTLSDVLRTAS